MIRFFQTPQKTVIATEVNHALNEQEINELNWLYGDAKLLDAEQLEGYFVGPQTGFTAMQSCWMPSSWRATLLVRAVRW